MKKMRKMLALLLCAGMILGLAACGSKEEPAAQPADTNTAQEGGEAAADTKDHEDVTLEVQIVQTDWSDAWDVMEERFETEYPWIDVVSVGVGEATSDFINNRAAANDLPAVIQLDNGAVYRSLTDEGKIVDLSGYSVAANIPDSYKDAFMYNGTLMGLTQGAAFSTVYLNMSILKEAGWETAPTNWDEFIQCCKDIQDKTDVAPLTVAGDKTTNCWMVYECILANVCGEELGFGTFEEQFMDGTFDFAAQTKATEMLAEIAPFMMTGTSSMTEDDVTAAFADGSVAMAMAGNWTANNICDAIAEAAGDPAAAVAILPPFNEAGKDPWISVSPETAFALTVQDDPNVKEAADIFFEWIFQPENFMLIQNARGTVPVLSTMTEDQIILPDAIAAIVPAMNAASYVKMGFNCWTSEFRDSACTALKDVYAGNMKAEDATKTMSDSLKENYVNQ